ncbi:YbgF trimerization domain-containing protein [Acinetobacter baumannii]|uniref:YbgF trimerization domain-containing protein n=1 Tax=Acinetobacter baumannii TaxID=470 RepID=UPI00186B6404|nr:YbgF trimerization domain-containing protein [Acinetobacter baumannii]MBE4721125.1 tetratricopeptide repeat protein [Acinetobacter baumannii]MBE4723316.1 tetratricopeptide repeat protein [Acinetobacter baumannii]MDH2525422.1 YbgF trimerization domain-containing protein [Acinetobacter baumannii]MDN8266294.1 YbgF trimerization domain-containing protein [Acinetobacter baumannii]MDV7461250.1 YbgF trimerization domain-containing protein [Acinetobacter baumannii]
MQMKKHSLLFIALMSTTSLYANIPIESRGLSQNDGSASNTSSSNISVPTNLNWELMQKNQQLENDIRTLRGQLEEQANDIEQLKKDLANRYTDLDQRLELLHQKVDPDSATQDDSSNTTSDNTTPASVPATQTSEQQPSALTNTTQPAPAAAQNQSNSLELEKAAYTVALDAYKQGGAKKAIAPMQNFIKNHPNSIYTGNAYFWLAEFHLATDPVNYNEAKKNYNVVANQYPNSSKAPRALYQLYSIAKDVDKNTVSANQYKNKLLSQYPKSEEAKFFNK